MNPSFPTSFALLIVAVALGWSRGAEPSDEITETERSVIADSIRTLLTTTYTFDGSDPVPRFMKL